MSVMSKPREGNLQDSKLQSRLASLVIAKPDPQPSGVDHPTGVISSSPDSISSDGWGSALTSTISEESLIEGHSGASQQDALTRVDTIESVSSQWSQAATFGSHSSMETIRDSNSDREPTNQFGHSLSTTPTDDWISNGASLTNDTFRSPRPQLSISTRPLADDQPQDIEYSPTEVSDSPRQSPVQDRLPPSGLKIAVANPTYPNLPFIYPHKDRFGNTTSAQWLPPFPEKSFYSFSPEERKIILETEEFIRKGTVRPNSVVCVKCGERVILDKGIPFLPRRWLVHRNIHCPVLNPKDESASQESYYDEEDAEDGASQSSDLH